MEHTAKEADVLQKAANEAFEKSVQLLDDLQLALVGGGSGDTLPM